jgi:hypothetical protein
VVDEHPNSVRRAAAATKKSCKPQKKPVVVFMPSSSALIPMSNCTLECLFSHSFTTYEWLNRDCDVQIDIGITSRWTGYLTLLGI